MQLVAQPTHVFRFILWTIGLGGGGILLVCSPCIRDMFNLKLFVSRGLPRLHQPTSIREYYQTEIFLLQNTRNKTIQTEWYNAITTTLQLLSHHVQRDFGVMVVIGNCLGENFASFQFIMVLDLLRAWILFLNFDVWSSQHQPQASCYVCFILMAKVHFLSAL